MENGGDAEYGEGESWAAAPNGEAISGILEGVSGNLDVYSLLIPAVRISTKTTTNATITVELGTYDIQTSTFTKESSSNIVWNSSSVLTYSTSIPNPALPYVRNGFLTLWYYETGNGATATWRTAAYTDTVYGDQTYSAGTQIVSWTSVTNQSGLLFYQAQEEYERGKSDRDRGGGELGVHGIPAHLGDIIRKELPWTPIT